MIANKSVELYERMPESDSIIRINLYDNMVRPCFPFHWHEHLEIHYIIEGTAKIRCENDVLEVTEGECLIINSNEMHEGAGGSCRYMCMLIPPGFARNSNVILNRIVKDLEIKAVLEIIINEYKEQNNAYDVAISGYVALILTKLYRNYVFKEIREEKYKAYSQRILMLNEIIRYIHENFSSETELADTAKEFNINMYHLCHIFKEHTGKTFKEYLNGVRIDKAEELIKTTDASICEIAGLCGFNDSNYFSRKFRQIKGMSPREARREDVKIVQTARKEGNQAITCV